jgi:hypothetical protein
MDRKYFYALVKGLTIIKYKEAFLRSKRDFDIDESMDLQFLYANLFNDQETSLDCKDYSALLNFSFCGVQSSTR